MNKNELINISNILEHHEVELSDFLRVFRQQIKVDNLLLDELKEYQEINSKIRFGASAIYSAALGLSKDLYEMIEKKEGKQVTVFKDINIDEHEKNDVPNISQLKNLAEILKAAGVNKKDL